MKYFLSLLCSLMMICSCATNSHTDLLVSDSHIPNLKHVVENIWRGGQPKTDADWQYLQKLGITRVIKLNTNAEGSDEGAKKYGMEVVYEPIDFVHQTVKQPDDNQIVDILIHIKHEGTFIHCSHGEDRTGLIVGIHRLYEGWSPEQAYEEMKDNGFHPALLGLYMYWLGGQGL